MRSSLTSLIAITLLAATTASAKELWEQPWIEVRTPHFRIVSALPEKRTVALADELEDFRAAVQLVTHIGRFEERIATTVYVLPYAVEQLGFRSHISGFFMPQMRANYAAVIPLPPGLLDEALKHEYIHFLVRNRDVLSYPPWFDEGLAEVLQTLKAQGAVIEYGLPTRMRVEWLNSGRWMPFAKLLETRDLFRLNANDTAMFYAQAWLLMHFLLIGRPDHQFDVDSRAFLGSIEAGVQPSAAFEQAFGLPVASLDPLLARYARDNVRHRRISLGQAPPMAPTSVRNVAADTIAAEMGVLLRLREETDEAKRYWEAAIALNPNNCIALAGIGDYHKIAGRFDEAAPYFEKAIAVEPENALAELDYAEFLLDRARAAHDPDAVHSDLAAARQHLERSYDLDPDNPETLAMNGVSYMFVGEPLHKAIESLRVAHEMVPSQPAIKLLLAEAYAESGEFDSATKLLLSLVASSDTKVAEQAALMLGKLTSTAQ